MTTGTVVSSALRTQRAAGRGQRLFPTRSNRTYAVLTALRTGFEEVIAAHVAGREINTLVDYGCGNMPYRALFADHVENYIGADLPGNELATCTITENGCIQVPSDTVDIVLSSQVLEHVTDPGTYLHEAYRLLKPDGVLILSTHGLWKYHPDPQDLWRWTSAGLRKIVTESGFDIASFRGILGPAATALQLWQDATLASVPRILRRGFVIGMQRLIRWSDRRCPEHVRARDACVYIVVARKLASPLLVDCAVGARNS